MRKYLLFIPLAVLLASCGKNGPDYTPSSELAGVKGRAVRVTDNNGDTLSSGKTRYYKAQDGYSIVTTIDSVIQHFVEDAIQTGMKRTVPPST